MISMATLKSQGLEKKNSSLSFSLSLLFLEYPKIIINIFFLVAGLIKCERKLIHLFTFVYIC